MEKEKLQNDDKISKEYEKNDSISNKIIMDSAKLSSLIKNEMPSEKCELENLDKNLMNLAEASVNQST